MMDILLSPIGFIVILLLLWIGMGALLLWFFSRPAGPDDFIRAVGQRIVTYSEPVDVTLKLKPPLLPMTDEEPHDVVLVLDHSSSMGAAPGSPLREAVRSMHNFVSQLPANYRTGLVIFDHEAQVLCPSTDDPKQLLRALKTIAPGGATAIHDALDKALEVLESGREGVKKTVILLSDGASDRVAAEQVADRVKKHSSKPAIICVGFGAYVDEKLLSAIADCEDHYIHVDRAADLESLFTLLAREISGARAQGGLINERMMTPTPFRLDNTGALSPLTVEPSRDFTQTSWSLVVLKASVEPITLDYRLLPVCIGWHRIAPAGARALWTRPDGGGQETVGKAGPRVLVLPDGFGWMWPIMNPLFWMLFGALFRCARPAESAPNPVEAPSIKEPTLPTPIAAPEFPSVTPQLKSALVIGLGVLGEWTVTRLKWRLKDRQADLQKVDLVAVSDCGVWSRPSVECLGVSLDQGERLILQQDLRPYLEALRHQPPSATRHWLPLRQWLRESLPMTRYGDDRRKARLALLLDSTLIENTIEPMIDRVRNEEGIIIVVADPNEAEGSGLLAEVAHLCATFSQGVEGITAVLSPDDARPSSQCVGMVYELNRLLSMRGEAIYSDRGERPTAARQLFDRVLVTEPVRADSDERSRLCEHLVWDLLAFPKVLEQLPSLSGDQCYQVRLSTQVLPQFSLWEWVRERTLSERVNGLWLGVDVDDHQVNPPQLSAKQVEQYVDAFWNGGDFASLPGRLLQQSALVRKKSAPFVITEDLTGLPFNHPEHEQRVYCDGERHYFGSYLKRWCDYMLREEAERRQWGLPLLLEAVMQVEQDLERLIDGAEKLAGSIELAPRIKLVTELYLDYLCALVGLRSALERWITCFVGWRPTMKISPPPGDYLSVSVNIETRWRKAASRLVFEKNKLLETAYRAWLNNFGGSLDQQLCFKVNPDHQAQGFDIQLQIFEQTIDVSSANKSDAVSDALRTALDRYQNVITQWPKSNWFDPAPSSRHVSQARPIGKFAGQLYPGVGESLDGEDPFIAASMTINQLSLNNAFKLDSGALGIPAWPEEANAARIANKMRNKIDYTPSFDTHPVIVSLMRNSEKLYGLMVDLAAGKVRWQNDKVEIRRNGDFRTVGPTRENLIGIELFHDLVRQVGVQGATWPDGHPLPATELDWCVSPDEAVKQVENHPLVKEVVDEPEWSLWREVIKGLVIEYTRC